MTDAANLKNYYVEVRRGNVPGHRVVHKFGDNLSVINGVWSLVSSVTKIQAMPQSGSPVRIKTGGNAADDMAGSGCQSIKLLGIDTNFNEVSETIVTAGASASASSIHSYWRLYRMEALAVGTYGGANIGTVIVENIDGSSDRLSIRAEEGQSQHGAWSVGAGKKAYLIGINVESDGAKAADFKICIRQSFDEVTSPMMSSRLQLFLDGVMGLSNIQSKSPSIILPPISDIWIEAEGGGANTEVSVDFEMLVIDEPVSHILSV